MNSKSRTINPGYLKTFYEKYLLKYESEYSNNLHEVAVSPDKTVSVHSSASKHSQNPLSSPHKHSLFSKKKKEVDGDFEQFLSDQTRVES